MTLFSTSTTMRLAPGPRAVPVPGHRHGGPAGLRRSLHAAARTARDHAGEADGAVVSVVLGAGGAYAGSDAWAEAVEEVQHALGEGPGPTATTGAATVRSGTIGAGEGRWPRFAERVRVLGVGGVVVVPLLAGDDRLGSLTLWFRDAGGLEATGETVLRRTAEATLRVLLDVRLRALLEESVRCLEGARRDRAEVDHAVGLLVDRYGFTANQALVLVVQLARQDGVSAVAAARALTGRPGAH